MSLRYQEYSSLVKAKVVTEVLKKGRSLEEVSEHFGIPLNLIETWIATFLKENPSIGSSETSS